MAFLRLLGLMTVKEHDRIVAKADAVIDDAARLLDREGIRGRSLAHQVSDAIAKIRELKASLDYSRHCGRESGHTILSYRDRLERIAAQATPGANATVKRMAAIARGEDLPTKVQQPTP